jgi:DNA polymerase-2
VVHLYGRLESGEPFLVRDDTLVPHFFIRAADAAAARGLGAARIHQTDLRTLRGERVVRVEVAVPADTPPLRDRLAAAGVAAFEADVRFAMRFLMDRGIKGSMEIEPGPAPVGSRPAAPAGSRPAAPAAGASLRVFERPVLTPCAWAPKLRVLSLDVETDPRGRRVHAVALHGADLAEVLYVAPEGPAGRAAAAAAEHLPFAAVPCADEAALLRGLCDRVAALDPDVLTGWNVVDFDLRVLEAAGRRAGVPLRLGRTPEPVRLRLDEAAGRSPRAEIAGRCVLDGIALLKGAFVRLEDYRLETAARAILGEGKRIAARDRAEEIERLYREELPRFLDYNMTDARLVTDILDRTGVVDLAVRRSLLTGMPPDRVSSSIASFDALYLPELRRRGRVAPSVSSAAPREATLGGAVLEPVPGLHPNVCVFDFRSLYPSIIRTYNLDPLGLAPAAPGAAPAAGGGPRASGLIRAPNGALFRREPGILPGILGRLAAERAAARARGDEIASQAIKILMNSCYGVLATPACRFHSTEVANAITHFGQETLRWTKARAEELGYAVLYGDTDSLFVAAGTPDPAEARRKGEALAARLNDDLKEHVRRTHDLESFLELQFQRLFLRMFLPRVRHGTAGARKRYAGLVLEGDRPAIHAAGMEMVRRDWTALSKIFQRGLFERLFSGEDPGPYIRAFIEELRAGAHDAHLVYRKALRKDVAAYTATTPPHVKAALQMGGRPGRLIEYVMTVDGPEPAASRRGAFDYEHYVEKQIRPVAEAVLSEIGLSFDEVAGPRPGEGTQLDLF